MLATLKRDVQMAKSMNGDGERIERGRVPKWLIQCCKARYGGKGGRQALCDAIKAAELKNDLAIDHTGTLVLPGGSLVWISEPYSRAEPDKCEMWREFKRFADSLGLTCEWSAKGTWHEETRRFRMFPPDNLDSHLAILQQQRAKVADDAFAELVRSIQGMRDAGKTHEEIAHVLNGRESIDSPRWWSARYVSRVLKRSKSHQLQTTITPEKL